MTVPSLDGVIADLFGQDADVSHPAKMKIKGMSQPLARIVLGLEKCPKALQREIRKVKKRQSCTRLPAPSPGPAPLQYRAPLAKPRWKLPPPIERDDIPGNTDHFAERQVDRIHQEMLSDWLIEFARPRMQGADIDPLRELDWSLWMVRETGPFTFRECLQRSDNRLPVSVDDGPLRQHPAIQALIPAWIHPILRLPLDEQWPAGLAQIRALRTVPPIPDLTTPVSTAQAENDC